MSRTITSSNMRQEWLGSAKDIRRLLVSNIRKSRAGIVARTEFESQLASINPVLLDSLHFIELGALQKKARWYKDCTTALASIYAGLQEIRDGNESYFTRG